VVQPPSSNGLSNVRYDQGLLARCLDVLRTLGAGPIRNKNVFGMRGLLRGSTMFAAVGESSMIVKLRAAEYDDALGQEGARPFTPMGQRLGFWVELELDAVADDPQLRHWLELGLRTIR
jgi:TfoX/Sxy family transcriptional regulator of competence genes